MKIKEEQLNTIREQQQKLTGLINDIGLLEAQKHNFLHKIAEVNIEVEATKKELEDEYGAVNIDLETGTYTEIEQPKEVVSDVK
jgi:hypothetical protein